MNVIALNHALLFSLLDYNVGIGFIINNIISHSKIGFIVIIIILLGNACEFLFSF